MTPRELMRALRSVTDRLHVEPDAEAFYDDVADLLDIRALCSEFIQIYDERRDIRDLHSWRMANDKYYAARNAGGAYR